MLRMASTIFWSMTSVSPSPALATRSRRRERVRVWPASHLLNWSESLAIRKMRSSWVRSVVSLTGALKLRKIDGTGFSPTHLNTNVCELSESLRTFVVSPFTASPSNTSSMSDPSGARRPTAMGMSTGLLSLWPGVPAMDCVQVMVNVLASESYSVVTSSVGVPACEYQGLNAVRSASLASAIAARKSSHVTAWPSCLAK